MKKRNISKTQPVFVRKGTREVIEIIGYDEGRDCYVCKDNSLIDFVQIVSKDLINAADDDVNYDCLKFAKMYKLYAPDLKIVAINFPVDTSEQQEFFRHKINATKNHAFRKILNRRLKELEWIAKNNTAREYYYMMFLKDDEELDKCRDVMDTTLKTGMNPLIRIVDKEKKDQILFRMNNKCYLVH